MFVQVIQGGVIGQLTVRYSENSLLLLSIGVSSLVGLAQVHKNTHIIILLLLCVLVFSSLFCRICFTNVSFFLILVYMISHLHLKGFFFLKFGTKRLRLNKD